MIAIRLTPKHTQGRPLNPQNHRMDSEESRPAGRHWRRPARYVLQTVANLAEQLLLVATE
jgi:hypothetical protein